MSHVRRLSGTLPLAAALAVATGACGHRGDPLPPKRHTPASLSEFRLAQRGSTLEVSALAPAASVDGLPYESLGVEFLFVEGQKDLEKAGSRRELVALPRQRVVETLPLPAPGTIARAAARGVYGKQRGARTLIMALVAQPEVAAPRELAASLSEEGVLLEWTGELPQHVDAAVPPPRLPGMTSPQPRSGATPPGPVSAPGPPGAAQAEAPRPEAPKPEPGKPVAAQSDASGAPAAGVAGEAAKGDKPGSDESDKDKKEKRVGFFIYRRAGSAAYAAPLMPRPHEARSLKDTTAPQGEKVCYVVRAVASLDPLVESAASNEACLDVRDISPPAAPTGLAVLPRERGLELVWTPNTEEDLARYRVYREAAGEPRQRLAEVDAGQAAWTDTTAKPGVTYRYTLTAVDRSGNESPETPPVEANRE